MAIKVFAQDVELQAAPIPPGWVLGGAPMARNAVLARSADRTALTMLWDATLTLADGRVARLRPAGKKTTTPGRTAVWEVDSYVRKLAVFREPVPLTLALVVRCWAKLRTAVAAAAAHSARPLAAPVPLKPRLVPV